MNRSMGRSRSEGASSGKPATQGVQVHGWALFAHPCFLDQLENLLSAVEDEAVKHPARYRESASYKVLNAIAQLAFDLIPQDPARKEYRHGGVLTGARRHWFRAKFGGGRFRLFFRFRADVKVIVFGWVNDQETLRTYGSRTDSYAVFGRMLNAGYPPDDWDALVAEASTEEVRKRTGTAGDRIASARAGRAGPQAKRGRKKT